MDIGNCLSMYMCVYIYISRRFLSIISAQNGLRYLTWGIILQVTSATHVLVKSAYAEENNLVRNGNIDPSIYYRKLRWIWIGFLLDSVLEFWSHRRAGNAEWEVSCLLSSPHNAWTYRLLDGCHITSILVSFIANETYFTSVYGKWGSRRIGSGWWCIKSNVNFVLHYWNKVYQFFT